MKTEPMFVNDAGVKWWFEPELTKHAFSNLNIPLEQDIFMRNEIEVHFVSPLRPLAVQYAIGMTGLAMNDTQLIEIQFGESSSALPDVVVIGETLRR